MRGGGVLGSFTDARAIAVGQEILGELAIGGTDEFDCDLVGVGGCSSWGGAGRDHGGQEGESGDGEGLHGGCFWDFDLRRAWKI